MDIQLVLAATVHDVKNSLGVIDSELNDIVKRIAETDAQSAKDIHRIQLECGRINNGLVHMLGFYKLNNGTFSPNFDEVLVEDVIVDATSRYTELLTSLGIELEVNIVDEDCLWLMDATLIEGLLANVLTNSIRYTESKLVFSVSVKNDWLNIKISDNGRGYPEKMLTLLSEPEEISFQSGGTGLGIFFCQRIAKMHVDGDKTGYIELSNADDNSGAIFDLWLP